MWKEKLGNYLIDVSKYVLTGVVITSLFKDLGESRQVLYWAGSGIAVFGLGAGLLLTNKKKEKK